MSIQVLPISTDKGKYVAIYDDHGLRELRFPHHASPATESQPGALHKTWHKQTTLAVKEILAGRKVQHFPPLSLEGTDFQKAVWRQLQKIPLGKTASYGAVAKEIGRPGATRAVGSACGKNPVPLLIPCHRVLAANGKLGGFSGGLEMKIELLAAEGIHF